MGTKERIVIVACLMWLLVIEWHNGLANVGNFVVYSKAPAATAWWWYKWNFIGFGLLPVACALGYLWIGRSKKTE